MHYRITSCSTKIGIILNGAIVNGNLATGSRAIQNRTIRVIVTATIFIDIF